MKESIYKTSVADNKEVMKRIEAAVALVYTGMLQGTLLELEYCLDTAGVTNGAHFLCV